MIKRLLFLAFIILIFTACKKEEALLIKPMNFSEKVLPGCDTNCPEITVNYIVLEDESERSTKINSRITEFIIDALYLGEEESSSAKNSFSA